MASFVTELLQQAEGTPMSEEGKKAFSKDEHYPGMKQINENDLENQTLLMQRH